MTFLAYSIVYYVIGVLIIVEKRGDAIAGAFLWRSATSFIYVFMLVINNEYICNLCTVIDKVKNEITLKIKRFFD